MLARPSATPSELVETCATRPLLRFAGVGFAVGATTILRDVTLELSDGGPTVLLGPNGCGKTTLLKLAMGLADPTSGSISWVDGPPSTAFVFQKPVMLRRTALANVAYAAAAAGRPTDRSTLVRLLERVGLASLADRPARRLSGGEQQRLALARALARAPRVLFLDEPTASLDPAATKAVEDIIADTGRDDVKIVMATHDLGQARRLARDVVFLAAGRLVERASADRFFNAPTTEAARRFLAGDLVI